MINQTSFTLKDLEKQQKDIFGINYEKSLLIDPGSLKKAQEDIIQQLKISQTARVLNSKRLKNLKLLDNKEMSPNVDLNKELSNQNQLDYINKLQRIQKRNRERKVFTEIIMNQVDDQLAIEEGTKISMKQIDEIFSGIGFELSKVQLNELFLEMDAGRKFMRSKFEKWVKKNYQFILQKDQKVGPLISEIAQKQYQLHSRNQGDGLVNTYSQPQINFDSKASALEIQQAKNYFKRSRKTVEFSKSEEPTKKTLNLKQIEKNLKEWSTNVTKLNVEVYDKQFYEQDRRDRDLANKIFKFCNPFYQEKESLIEQKKFKKLQNKTVDQIDKANPNSNLNTNTNVQPQIGGVLSGSFYNNSKINFFNKDNLQKNMLEKIEENPQPAEINQYSKKRNPYLNASQTLITKQLPQDGRDTISNENSNQPFVIKQDTQIFNQAQKQRQTFYETFNNTFYTQTESFYDEDIGIKEQNKLKEKAADPKTKSNTKDISQILKERQKENKKLFQKTQRKKAEVQKILDMIESNNRAKSLMRNAVQAINRDRFTQNSDEVRDYQEEVRKRLRDKKYKNEQQQEYKVAYIASMLPSAIDMLKFTKFMKRDKVFESETGYKIVSQIRTHKDKERLEYLLNYNLSAK